MKTLNYNGHIISYDSFSYEFDGFLKSYDTKLFIDKNQVARLSLNKKQLEILK